MGEQRNTGIPVVGSGSSNPVSFRSPRDTKGQAWTIDVCPKCKWNRESDGGLGPLGDRCACDTELERIEVIPLTQERQRADTIAQDYKRWLEETEKELVAERQRVEELERNCDSLRLERDGLEHVRKLDNAELIAQRDEARRERDEIEGESQTLQRAIDFQVARVEELEGESALSSALERVEELEKAIARFQEARYTEALGPGAGVEQAEFAQLIAALDTDEGER